MAAESGNMKRKNIKYQSITEVLLVVILLVLINAVSSFVYTRFDLTKEKRYTLSPQSKNLTDKLEDKIYVKIYLGDNLNPGFKRLKNSIKDMLEEYRRYSNGKVEYEFIDPFDGKSKAEKQNILNELMTEGLRPIDVLENEADQKSSRLLVPGATFYYKTTQKVSVNFLKEQFGQNAESILNQSIEGLEFEISNVVRKFTNDDTKDIAFLSGHDELSAVETQDIRNALSDFYKVETFNFNFSDTHFLLQFVDSLKNVDPDSIGLVMIRAVKNKLKTFDAIVVAKPRIAFNEQEKYYLDQYIMQGGKVVWLIDQLIAEMDTLEKYPAYFTADYDLNLNDMFFQYGFRVNPDLVLDLQCNRIPIITSYTQNGQPQQRLFNWAYFPIVTTSVAHPISKNLDPIWFRFANSIDVVGNKLNQKIPLLTSSPYTKLSNNPVQINVKDAGKEFDERYFNKPEQTMALLIKGKFESGFKNREKNFDGGFEFIKEVDSNAMIVISDGDLIRNNIRRSSGEVYPLGLDQINKTQFANKKFFVNCMDYLLDNSNLLEVRTKELKLRLLNTQKVKTEKSYWIKLNIILPIVLLIVFGIANYYIRKYKYAK